MGRSDRLFEVIQLLRRAKRPVTAQRIAQALEVTSRTVYRDIVALQAMRVPIQGEAGVGYHMQPGFDLPPLMFNSEEMEAIVVGLALLRRTGDRGLLRAAQSVQRKIGDVVPRELRASLEQGALQVSGYGVNTPSRVDPGLLRDAIRVERKLRLRYEGDTGACTERVVLPLAVFYYVEVVVLAAWCELRQDFRHFRVDRMAACTALDAFFKPQGQTLRAQWFAQQEQAQRQRER